MFHKIYCISDHINYPKPLNSSAHHNREVKCIANTVYRSFVLFYRVCMVSGQECICENGRMENQKSPSEIPGSAKPVHTPSSHQSRWEKPRSVSFSGFSFIRTDLLWVSLCMFLLLLWTIGCTHFYKDEKCACNLWLKCHLWNNLKTVGVHHIIESKMACSGLFNKLANIFVS